MRRLGLSAVVALVGCLAPGEATVAIPGAECSGAAASCDQGPSSEVAAGTSPGGSPGGASGSVGGSGTGLRAGERDPFGVTALYASSPGARVWNAKWTGQPRTISQGMTDPLDPEFQARGSNQRLEVLGDGTARASGDTIRYYIWDQTGSRTWQNTEVTFYAKRGTEQSGAGSAVGFEVQTRTGDGHTSSGAKDAQGIDISCRGRSYGFSLRFDGRAIMEKELKHPVYTPQVSKQIWSGQPLPKGQWIGVKIITRNIDGGAHVRQEIWRDTTDGANGGTWEKVLEHDDTGGWAVSAAVAESCQIPADKIITEPGAIINLRNDAIVEQWFKKLSVREINP